MVTGTFEGLIVVKEGNGKKGPWKLYNIKVDGKKYGIGFKPVKAGVGETVQFEAEQNENGYWDANPDTFKVIGNTGRSGTAGATGTNSFGADPRQASIELQVCLKTAGEIAAAAVGAGTITPDQAADYKVLQAEVGQTTDAFAIDESSEWRNYYDNEYRDALKQAVNGDLTPSDALTEFATALADKAGWAH